VVVSAARGNRCNRTTGVEVVRRSHPRTREVEREPPNRNDFRWKRKAWAKRIKPREIKGSERAEEGGTETNKTSKRQLFVFDQTKDEYGSSCSW
jgi:hypothetical protein